MKTFILIALVVLTFIVHTPEAYALFGHVQKERHQKLAVEQRLTEQQHLTAEQQQLTAQQQRLTATQQQLTNRWQNIAFVSSVGAVVTLIIGTAIGSKTKGDYGR